MKVKNDFITNSSSASFILGVVSTTNNLKEFKRFLNKYLEDFMKDYFWKVEEGVKEYKKVLKDHKKEEKDLKKKIENGIATDGEKTWYKLFHQDGRVGRNYNKDIRKGTIGASNLTINKVTDNYFEIIVFTGMLNHVVEDLPSWMNNLILVNNMEPKDLIQYGIRKVKLSIEED